MSALTDVAELLESRGIGVRGETLFLSTRPDDPDELICVFQYRGRPPEYVQESYMPIAEYPQIQIVTRSYDPERAEELAYKAWRAIAAITNATLSGTRYRSIRPDASPALLGRDASERILFVFNAAVDKEVPVA